jgi:uncharacterized LabA/DUF88 family protein
MGSKDARCIPYVQVMTGGIFMEKVVLFVDYANVNRAAREKRYRLDYHDLLQYVAEQRFLIDAHCYVPINPRNEHRLDGVVEELWRSGYIVTTKMGTIAGGTYKCNFDVEITMDVLKVAYQVKPDIIVLASGDSDFVPLIQEVRKSGIRVEVAAFEESAGIDIMLKCSGFIDLAVYYEGYLAAQNGEQDEDREEEQYKELIQVQGSVLGEDDVQVPVDSSARKKITVPLSDPIDRLDLESSID